MPIVGPQGPAGGEAYRWFTIAGAAVTSDRFLDLGELAVIAQELRSKRLVLRPTTITKLRVYFTVPYAVATATLCLRKNGVDTSLVGTIAPGTQTLLVSSSVVIAAGDAISLRITLSSAEANAGLGASAVVY